MKAVKPGAEDLHRLLGAVKEAIEGGRLRPDLTDERAPLLTTALVRQLIAGDRPAAAPDRLPLRTDFAQELQPALTCGRPLVGVLAESSLLFSSRQQDKELRRRLLAEERLLAVIDLPPSVLRKSGFRLCILILVPHGTAKEVMFLDAGAEGAGFFEEGAVRGQAHLCSLDRLASTLVRRAGDWWFTILLAAAPELPRNISPRAHVRTPLERQVDHYFGANGEFRVGDVFGTVVTLPTARAEEPCVDIKVVNPVDLPALGVVERASGQRKVPADELDRRPERFLAGGDLLVNYRPAGGIRIAVVPDAAPTAGAEGWIAGRTVWVYRPRVESRSSTRALAMMLASPLGAHLLHQALHGRHVATPRLLLELRLPAVDDAAVREAEALFNKHLQYEEQIRDLAQRQAELPQQFWPLQASQPETRTNS